MDKYEKLKKKNIFLDMDKSLNAQVKVRNGALMNVIGKCTNVIQTKEETKFIQETLLINLEQDLPVGVNF